MAAYERIALCKGKYFISVSNGDGTLMCSCPSWTRHTPRVDCKHAKAFRNHMKSLPTGEETFVLMETDAAKPKIAAFRPKVPVAGQGVSCGICGSTVTCIHRIVLAPVSASSLGLGVGPVLGAAQPRMQSYNTRPTPADQCFRQGCKAKRATGSQFCSTHDPAPRPLPVPTNVPASPAVAVNRMANLDINESLPDTPVKEDPKTPNRFSLIELD